jgi:hypothetical protein
MGLDELMAQVNETAAAADSTYAASDLERERRINKRLRASWFKTMEHVLHAVVTGDGPDGVVAAITAAMFMFEQPDAVFAGEQDPPTMAEAEARMRELGLLPDDDGE